MKQSEFIEILEKEGIEYKTKEIEYKIECSIIIILGNKFGNVDLDLLKSISKSVQFNNIGYVKLNSLESLPKNIRFNNRGFIDLYSLKSLHESTKFNNIGDVYLNSLESLPENFQFNNSGAVYLRNKRVEVKPQSKVNKEPIEKTKTKRRAIQKLRIYSNEKS